MGKTTLSLIAAFMTIFASNVAFASEGENIAVAASIYPCVEEMAKRFESSGGKAPQFVPGTSGNLAAQIQAGAPFGIFLSANVPWAQKLADEGILEDLRPLASSPVVMWWSKDETPPLGDTLKDLTVAIADPSTAPFGKAGKEYLQSLGLYDSMMEEKRIVIAGSVLNAALATDNGGSDVSILSLSIAIRMEKGRYVALPIPPLENAGGLVKGRYTQSGRAFWEFIRSPELDSIWEEWGFQPLGR